MRQSIFQRAKRPILPPCKWERIVGRYVFDSFCSVETNPRIPTTRSLLRRGYVGSENIRWQWKLRSIRRHWTQTGYSMIWKGVKVTKCNFALCGSHRVHEVHVGNKATCPLSHVFPLKSFLSIPSSIGWKRILLSKTAMKANLTQWEKVVVKSVPTQVSVSVASHVAIQREEGRRSCSLRGHLSLFSHDTHSERERERERERRERQERLGRRAAGRRCGFHAACDEAELKLPPSLARSQLSHSKYSSAAIERGQNKFSATATIFKFPKEFSILAYY